MINQLKKTERALLNYFTRQMPDYVVEIGESDFGLQYTGFAFRESDNGESKYRTVLQLGRSLITLREVEKITKILEHSSWKTLIEENHGSTVCIDRDGRVMKKPLPPASYLHLITG
jgi:hypothetical protein